MPDSNTLSFALLLDWIEGHLPIEEASALAEQVAQAGATTQTDVAWLHAFRAISASTVLVAPPPETHTLLEHSFAEYAQSRRQPGIARRLVATLAFDSGMQPALFGVRSAGTTEPQRQLIYATQVADIALNFQPHQYNRNLDVRGQIFPKDQSLPDSFSVRLLHGLETVGRDGADELGEFVFDDIPPGVYVLSLRAGQLDLLVAPIEVYA
jgi:hypothetical protein